MNAMIYLINNDINISANLYIYMLWGQGWDFRQLKCLLGQHSGAVVITVASQKVVLSLNPNRAVECVCVELYPRICCCYLKPQIKNGKQGVLLQLPSEVTFLLPICKWMPMPLNLFFHFPGSCLCMFILIQFVIHLVHLSAHGVLLWTEHLWQHHSVRQPEEVYCKEKPSLVCQHHSVSWRTSCAVSHLNASSAGKPVKCCNAAK